MLNTYVKINVTISLASSVALAQTQGSQVSLLENTIKCGKHAAEYFAAAEKILRRRY
jgi:hypothetical protein